jgi:lysophospholipase L1-like esterase
MMKLKIRLVFSLVLIQTAVMGQYVRVENQIQMLALGDSYTIGQSVEVDERWPHQFMHQLRLQGVEGSHPDYIATTGWTTGDLLNGIEKDLNSNKDYHLVSVLIGVNNQYQGRPIENYEPDLRKILDKALEIVRQDSTRVFILSIPDYAYTPFGGGNENISREIDAYNEIKLKVSREYGITWINITPISRGGLNRPSLVAYDGLHPSAEQYAMWVQEIMPRVYYENQVSGGPVVEVNGDVKLYPNPVTSWLHVDTSERIEYLQVVNSFGAIVHKETVETFPMVMDLSMLGPGFYTLVMYHENEERITRRSFTRL